MENQKTPSLAIGCIMKNEDWYVNDWIRYHLNLGIDHIYIYDNNDDEPIGKFIDRKYADRITIINVHGRKAYQIKAYNECYAQHWNEYDWIIFLDGDEYLTINDKSMNLKQLMSNPKYQRFYGVCFNWQFFSDNDEVYGNLGIPVWERFTKRVDLKLISERYPVKTFINTKRCGPHVNSTIHKMRLVDNFNRVVKYMCYPNGERITSGASGTVKITTDKIETSVAYIAHHITKTVSEYKVCKYKILGAAAATPRRNYEYAWWVNEKTLEKEHVLNDLSVNEVRSKLEQTWTSRPVDTIVKQSNYKAHVDKSELLSHIIMVDADSSEFEQCQKLRAMSGLPIECRHTNTHRGAILDAIDKELLYVFVLEDDVYPCIGLQRKLDEAISVIPSDCDVLVLGNLDASKLKTRRSDIGHLSKLINLVGQNAYVVFKRAYGKLVSLMMENPNANMDALFPKLNSYIYKWNLFVKRNNGQLVWGKRPNIDEFLEFPNPDAISMPIKVDRRKVVAMASFPPRKVGMVNAISQLIDQVDEIDLWLNEYDAIPEELNQFDKNKLKITLSKKNLKDLGRYTFIEQNKDAYLFICDDDVNYSKNYIQNTIEAMDECGYENVYSYFQFGEHASMDAELQYNKILSYDVKIGLGVSAFVPSCLGWIPSLELINDERNLDFEPLLMKYIKDNHRLQIMPRKPKNLLCFNGDLTNQQTSLYRTNGDSRLNRTNEYLRNGGATM